MSSAVMSAELADDARFLQQVTDFFARGAGTDRLDRDGALQVRILREVNAALHTLAERADDLEAADGEGGLGVRGG